MNRVKIIACAGTGIVLAALSCFLAAAPGALSNTSADMLSRSAGLALLGVALIAAGLAFRAAAHAEQNPASIMTRPQASEYRRGFGNRLAPTRAQVPQPMQRGLVVPLRHSAAEHGGAPEPGIEFSIAEIERLRNILHGRAARLRARGADRAKRGSRAAASIRRVSRRNEKDV